MTSSSYSARDSCKIINLLLASSKPARTTSIQRPPDTLFVHCQGHFDTGWAELVCACLARTPSEFPRSLRSDQSGVCAAGAGGRRRAFSPVRVGYYPSGERRRRVLCLCSPPGGRQRTWLGAPFASSRSGGGLEPRGGGRVTVMMGVGMGVFVVFGLLAWSGGVSALDVFWNVPTQEVRRNRTPLVVCGVSLCDTFNEVLD